jgi:regulation of enolase protein 1 (concanavalin A-like superfamily)
MGVTDDQSSSFVKELNKNDTYIRLKRYLRYLHNQNKLLPLLVLFLSLPVTLVLLKRGVNIFPEAQVPTANVFFNPSQTSLPPDNTLSLWVDVGTEQIGYLDIDLNFDTSKINVTGPIQTTTQFGTVILLTDPTTANSTGHIEMRLGVSPGDPAPTGSFEVATIPITSLSAVQNDSTQMTVDEPSCEIVTLTFITLAVNSTPADISLNPTGPTPTPTTPPAGARLFFSNPTPSNVGDTFTLDLYADTGGQDVDGVDSRIRFDPAILDVQSVNQGSATEFPSYPALDFDNAAGTVSISANIGSGASPSPANGANLHIGQINFLVDSATAGSTVSYDFTLGDRNDSNIVLSGTYFTQDPQDILQSVANWSFTIVGPSPTPTATPTPGVEPLPAPWLHTDVGNVNIVGDAYYSSGTDTFFNVADGSDIWFSSDEFHYIYQQFPGDGQIVAQVTGLENTDAWAKSGIMFRETLTDNSKNAFMSLTSGVGSSFQYRSTTSGNTNNVTPGDGISFPYYLRLVRSGDTFTAYNSSDRTSWNQVASVNIPMTTNIYVGMATTSHNTSSLNTSSFDNVLVTPAGQPSPTPSPTVQPTPTPTGVPQTVTIKLRFQGRLRVGASNAKTVDMLYRPAGGTALPLETFTTNDDGEGSVSIAPGDYVMLMDAPGYLQRRFGDDTNPVTITPGNLYLDLSSLPLLGGDFNDDGIVNAVDYTANFLPGFLTSDPVVDLDASGEVNNLDFTIMRNNWNLVDETG